MFEEKSAYYFEEKSAYCFEDHISLHAMRLYEFDRERSLVLISDDTIHGTAAVITSIKPLLNEFYKTTAKHYYCY